MRSLKNAGWSFQRSSRISTFSDPSFSRYVLSCQKQAEYTGGTVTFLGRLPADRDIMKTSQWDHIQKPVTGQHLRFLRRDPETNATTVEIVFTAGGLPVVEAR